MAQGFSLAIAAWMTTNLKRSPEGGLVWRFDLDGVEALIRDYFREDLWSMIEEDHDCEVHLVRAQRSDRWAPEILSLFSGSALVWMCFPIDQRYPHE